MNCNRRILRVAARSYCAVRSEVREYEGVDVWSALAEPRFTLFAVESTAQGRTAVRMGGV